MEFNIESEKFYNLMQDYRNAPLVPMAEVQEAYNEVICHISSFVYKQMCELHKDFDKIIDQVFGNKKTKEE